MPAADQVRLRDWRRDDGAERARIARLWRDSRVASGLAKPAEHALDPYLDRLVTEGRDRWDVTVAEIAPGLIGFVAWQTDGHLRQLFVAPSWQGRGIGSRLLAHVAERLPGGFWLHTDLDNAAARRFYEWQGMRQDGTVRHSRFGHEMARYRRP